MVIRTMNRRLCRAVSTMNRRLRQYLAVILLTLTLYHTWTCIRLLSMIVKEDNNHLMVLPGTNHEEALRMKAREDPEESDYEVSFGDLPDNPEDLWLDAMNEDSVVYIAKRLGVTFQVVNNLHLEDKDKTRIFLVLKNNGLSAIDSGPWTLYFNSLQQLSVGNLNCRIRLGQASEGLFYLTPAEDGSFRGIEPLDTIVCILHSAKAAVARSDFLPNWYITSPGTQAELVLSTMHDQLGFVGHFRTAKQWKQSKGDMYDPYNAQVRYKIHNRTRDVGRIWGHVIPTPRDVVINATVTIPSTLNDWVIMVNNDFENEIQHLSEAISLPTRALRPSGRYIRFVRSAAYSKDREAYELEINAQAETVEIRGHGKAGAFYGAQSLISLLEGPRRGIPSILIRDKPRFRYRGLMIDVAKNFLPKSAILKFLDAMSMYKLNRLQLHLADNSGWRLEIPAIPELTELGSRRCHDPDNKSCLSPSFGSGPDTSTSGSGFYTVSDYIEILRYARDHHILVIPGLSMPCNARAAVRSMKHRNRKLKTGSEPQFQSYALTENTDDENDNSRVAFGSCMNPCLFTTYVFVDKLIRELRRIHWYIQPLKGLHIGGDGVHPGTWNSSSSCRRLFPKVPAKHRTAALQQYFIRRVSGLLEWYNLSAAVWEQGLVDDSGKLYKTAAEQSGDLHVFPRDNIGDREHANSPYQFPNAGYKTVLSLGTHLSLDHPYEPDPEERGQHWSTRFTDTKTVFSFIPMDIYASAKVTRLGEPIKTSVLCSNDTACPKLTHPQNIIGIQACLWSAMLREEEHFHYMAFPRILALAERAWHEASWETLADDTNRERLLDADWDIFVNAVGHKELSRLERKDIHYRVPPPGARIEKIPGGRRVLMVNTLYPGLVVEWIDERRKMWTEISKITLLKKGHEVIGLRSKSPVLNRTSRVISLRSY